MVQLICKQSGSSSRCKTVIKYHSYIYTQKNYYENTSTKNLYGISLNNIILLSVISSGWWGKKVNCLLRPLSVKFARFPYVCMGFLQYCFSPTPQKCARWVNWHRVDWPNLSQPECGVCTCPTMEGCPFQGRIPPWAARTSASHPRPWTGTSRLENNYLVFINLS